MLLVQNFMRFSQMPLRKNISGMTEKHLKTLAGLFLYLPVKPYCQHIFINVCKKYLVKALFLSHKVSYRKKKKTLLSVLQKKIVSESNV